MRLDIHGENRLGISQEVLAVLAAAGIDVRAVEVAPHHIYIDAPSLAPTALPDLRQAVLTVPGIAGVTPVELLPTERRRMQLHGVLSALGDPVLAVDTEGVITQANSAAADALGVTDERGLRGRRLAELCGASLFPELERCAFSVSEREVHLGGKTFLARCEPLRIGDDPGARPRGGVLFCHPPARLGQMISALQHPDTGGFHAILGPSAVMVRLKEQAARLARIEAPLLILGETGTGKELFARACHAASPRGGRPFLALNCAALPEGLAESELFGYAAGAFTDARRGGKPGLLELAHGGTVFLDEVGELSPYLQAKLLRFLQDGSFRRVGGAGEIVVDVRVISATNRDLEAHSRSAAFREDLYFRLNVLSLELPPLRARRDDIPTLATAFIARAATRIGRAVPDLGADALAVLCADPWPGNVRELENRLFRAVSLLDGDRLGAEHLAAAPPGTADPQAADYATAFAAWERRYLGELYARYPSTRKLGARIGLSHATVAEKLRRHGIGRRI